MQIKLSPNGRLTIPAQIRRQLGIVPGDWLEIETEPGALRVTVIHPDQTRPAFPSGRGLAGYRGKRLEIEDMDPALACEQPPSML